MTSNTNGLVVLKFPSIRLPHISDTLTDMQVSWQDALHITTTASLRRTIQDHDGFALLMPQFVDLIITPTFPNRDPQTQHHRPMLFPITDFPHRTHSNFADLHQRWTYNIMSYRMHLALRFNNVVRQQLRTANPGTEYDITQAIYESRQTFFKSVQNLISSGIFPHQIQSADPVVQRATTIWQTVEQQESLSDMLQIRTDLWIDPREFIEQMTPHAISLRQRMLQALDRLYATPQTPRTIVYHGFFYYNPSQWALFHLLKHIPGVQQIFIVHDDDHNPVFESWRKYYTPQWFMPQSTSVAIAHTPTAAATAFYAALQRQPIAAEQLQSHLTLLECSTPAEFVSHINHRAALINTEHPPKLYAADAATINRYIDRLGISAQHSMTDLSKLPIGSFLMRIHECIPTYKHHHMRFTGDGIYDIIASGYLNVDGQSCQHYAPLWRQILPFFAGCDNANDWLHRAHTLSHQIVAIEHIHPTTPPENDAHRIRQQAQNFYHLLPWADLTSAQAHDIARILTEIHRLVASIATKEQVKLEQHFEFLRRELAEAMRTIPVEKRHEIDSKLTGIGMHPDQEIFVDELVDVVHMILGRSLPIDATGQEIEPEIPPTVANLRSIDTLGMQPITSEIHIANLADGIFPSQSIGIGWPFTYTDVANHEQLPSMQLQKFREQYTYLGDLYLLWLALDGVIGQPITLSWISTIAGETYNRASLLELLALPARPQLAAVLGGLPTQKTAPAYLGEQLHHPPLPVEVQASPSSTTGHLHDMHRFAQAAYVACPRRFAIQWGMGPSISFTSRHTHNMLYGNFLGASEQYRRFFDPNIIEQLWSFLSEGEKTSSYTAKRVGARGAKPAWMHILAGSRTGNTIQSKAYQVALEERHEPLRYVTRGQFLPDIAFSYHAHQICERCPIRLRCAVALETH